MKAIDLGLTAIRLRELAAAMRGQTPLPLDDLDRTLTVLEEKLFAELQASATEQELVDLKAQADRELAPYRSKMSAVQLRQVQQQFLHKRLLELHRLPRLSLFYMGHDD
jgi:predicted GTPase